MTAWSTVALGVCANLFIFGCGDDAATPPEGSLDGGGDAGGGVEAPRIPWLESSPAVPPTLLAPWGGGDPEECSTGSVHWPGAPGCEPLGSACPADGLPADLPADVEVTWVKAGATGGDGSRTLPFGSLREFSLARLRVGSILALGVGRYEIELRIPAGVTVWGACTGQTLLTSAVASRDEAVVTVREAGNVLRNLTIVDSERPGLLIENGELEVSQVAIERTRNAGVLVMGGTLDARDLVIRDTRPALDGRYGRGAVFQLGATVSLTRTSVEANVNLGVYASGAETQIQIEDSVVRDSQTRFGTGLFGRGIAFENGSRGEVSGTLLFRNRETALTVLGGTSARLVRSVVLDTLHDGAGLWGRGVGTGEGSSVELQDVVLLRNREVGVFAAGEGTSLVLTDVAVEGTLSTDALGTRGRALSAQRGATIEARRFVARSSRDVGISVTADATATLLDIVVVDTHSNACAETSCPDTPSGSGVGSFLQSDLSMSRFHVDRSALCGVYVADDSSLVLQDGLVTGNNIGACIQVVDYDIALLNDRVTYLENGTNLQSTDLPIPELGESVAPAGG